MNKPVKTRLRKWVEALRSGKYKQTQECLRDDRGYCCLGVADDVFRKETGIGKFTRPKNGDEFFFVVGEDEEEVGQLSDSVVKWFGLDDNDPQLNNYHASHWNDTCGYNFEQIADLIENEYQLKNVRTKKP